MLYGNESIASYSKANATLWMVLAFQAGLINVGGLMACHSFVSHITGFATLFVVDSRESGAMATIGILVVPLFFLVGAMVSGALIDLRLKLHKKPKYYVAFGVLFLLLSLAAVGGFNGFFGVFGESHHTTRDYTLIALLCLACGLQNGLVTLVSRSVVRTTHLTGITTDLGIGLVRILNSKRISESLGDERKANFMRAGIILWFLFGSAAGFEFFHRFEFRGFVFPAAIYGALFFLTYYFQVFRSKYGT